MNISPSPRARMLTAACAALSLPLLAATPALAASAPEETEGDSRIMLVMDASGSMGDELPDGQTRMDAAKASLHDVIGSIPDDTEVGLRVYGATEGASEANDRVCGDTQLVHPVGPLDRDALREEVDAMEPYGWTPIAHSLSEAAEDLGDEGRRHIILVSDGEETCTPDPCPEIREIIDSGIEVQIDTIGFGVDDTARSQLQCISEAAGGMYYDAEDADGLSVALERVTTRALREFNVTGTRVEGVDRNHLAQVPVLTAGQYVDTIATGDHGIRYYRIQREHPESRLSVSLTSRPPRAESSSWESFKISLVNDGGQSCSWDGQDSRWGSGLTDFVVASATSRSTWDSDRRDCLEPDSLLLQVQRRQGSQVPVDVELVVHEEPTLTSDAGLPAGLGTTPERPEGQTTGTPEPVVGGAAFSNAPELGSGTYVDELIPGEIVYYRIPVDWGQNAVLTVDGVVGDRYLGSGFNGSLRVLPRLYSPDRRNVTTAASDHTNSHTFALDELPGQHVMVIPDVRYLNRGENARNVGEHHLAGDYYYALAVPTNWQGQAEGRPVPVQFTVSVDGEVSGVPSYRDTRITAGGDDAASTDEPLAGDGDGDGDGQTAEDDAGTTAGADGPDGAGTTDGVATTEGAATTGGDDGDQDGDDAAITAQDAAGQPDDSEQAAQEGSGGVNPLLWVVGLGALFLVSFLATAVVNGLRRR